MNNVASFFFVKITLFETNIKQLRLSTKNIEGTFFHLKILN
jgi:hypothetical protein